MGTDGKQREPDVGRFAELVRQRRASLGLTLQGITALGGPSDSTLTKIENGEWRPRPPGGTYTMRKIDTGLRWELGSSARILYERGDPVPLPPLPTQQQEDAVDDDSAGNADLAIELTVLIESGSRSVWEALQSMDPRPPQAERAIDELDAIAYRAEKLALRLSGGDEDFARRRQQIRARARLDDHSLGERLRTAAAHGATAGQAAHPEDEYELSAPEAEDVDIARADADISEDD